MSNDRQNRAARAEQMRKEREKAERRQRSAITIGIVVVVIALIAGATIAIKQAKKDNSLNTTYIEPQHVTKDFGIIYDTEIATGKAATDPVKIVMYEDFQCPACQAFERADGAFLKQAVENGEITIEYRPISFLDSPVTDDYSSRALNAALCVLDSKGVKTYAAMHDILYLAQSPESGPGLTNAKLDSLTQQAGASGLSACINSKRFGPWIDKSYDASVKAKVKGTPTVLINGKKIENASGGVPSVADLQAAIAAAKGK